MFQLVASFFLEKFYLLLTNVVDFFSTHKSLSSSVIEITVVVKKIAMCFWASYF